MSAALVALGVASAAHAAGAAPPERSRTLRIGEARVRVILPARPVAAGDDAVLRWIEAAARAVAAYDGGFPVPAVIVRVRSHGGRGVGQGTARLAGAPEIRVSLGEETESEDLRRDWVMTHEMIHLGFPSVGDRRWMEEGLAMYVEPVVRARTGAISAEEAWAKLALFCPKGQPREGDRGLDLAGTWARTYWGGAMFWLVTDVEIRRRTAGRRGLEDVLRSVVKEGGTIGRRWDVERVLATADRIVGGPALRGIHRRMATEPDHVDLRSLWHALGVVRREDGGVTLDDAAPLAAVRRAITGPERDRGRAAR